MYAVQKIAMQYWEGPEKPGEVIYTVDRFDDPGAARLAAQMYNRDLAGNMWRFRYVVVKEASNEL